MRSNKNEPIWYDETDKTIYIQKERGEIALKFGNWVIFEENTDKCFWSIDQENRRSELESSVDEFYNIASAINALSTVLDLSEKDENDAVRLTMYTTNRGYHAQFDTIYSDISALIKYNNGTVSVTVVYDEGDIRDTIIKLANGVELVMEGSGYDAVYMEIQKTVKIKTNKLDTLVDEVKKAVKQVQEITVEDN